MDPRWQLPYGFRPTLRQMMILVVHVALISAMAAPLLRESSPRADRLLASLLLPLSPLILSLLILALDRPGPAKHWLVGLVASLTWPALVAWLDWLAATSGVLDRSAALAVFAVSLNAFGLVSLVRISRRLPGRCPECGLRTSLRLGRRSSGVIWCASCGRKRASGGQAGADRD